MAFFVDRADAGRKLARALKHYARDADVLVLALPRGGVPVAAEVARILEAPLDLLIVRKLGVPGRPELAMGAIASGGVRVINREIEEHLNIPGEVIEAVVVREFQELQRRERVYRGERPAADPAGKTVILVDDGLATGATMEAAIRAVDQRDPERIIVAVPVSSAFAFRRLVRLVDHLVCLAAPEPFGSVGSWYTEFEQVSDQTVTLLLSQAS